METTVITFNITSSFEDWINAYDESLPTQKGFGLDSLYRGHEKDDPIKCVVIVSAREGALDKFMTAWLIIPSDCHFFCCDFIIQWPSDTLISWYYELAISWHRDTMIR